MTPDEFADPQVRPAGPHDADIISEVIAASYGTLYRDWYDEELLQSALPLIVRANPRLLASGTFHVAKIEERIAGCGGWSVEAPGDGVTTSGVAHLRHFAVHPEFLRRGVGKALFSRCLEEVRAAGFREFECMASINATRFYESFGFRTVADKDAVLPDGIRLPSKLMRMRIG